MIEKGNDWVKVKKKKGSRQDKGKFVMDPKLKQKDMMVKSPRINSHMRLHKHANSGKRNHMHFNEPLKPSSKKAARGGSCGEKVEPSGKFMEYRAVKKDDIVKGGRIIQHKQKRGVY